MVTHPVLLAIKARRSFTFALGVLAMSLVVCLASTSNHGLINVEDVITPIVRVVPILGGCLVVAGAGIDFSTAELLSVGKVKRVATFILLAMTLLLAFSLSLGSYFGTLVNGQFWAISAIRYNTISALGWVSLTVFSNLLLGRKMLWVLPAIYLAFVSLFGYSGQAQPEVWNFTDPSQSNMTLFLVLPAYLAGLGLWIFLWRRQLPLVSFQ